MKEAVEQALACALEAEAAALDFLATLAEAREAMRTALEEGGDST